MGEPKVYYHRHLPHWQPEGATYHVVFRLDGSLPRNAVEDLREERCKMEKQLANIEQPDRRKELLKNIRWKIFEKYEALLDGRCRGPHWLRKEEAASIVNEAILHRDPEEYDLCAFTIMPNHVHMIFSLVRQADGTGVPSDIAQVDGTGVPSDATQVDGTGVPSDATQVDGTSVPSDVTQVDGTGVPSDVTQVDGTGASSDVTQVDGTSVPSDVTQVDGTGVPSDATQVDGTGASSDGTQVDGTGVPSDVTQVDGTSVPSDITQVDGTSVPSDVTQVDGTGVPSDATQVDGTGIPSYVVSNMLGSLKKYTARRINKMLHRSGPFWQNESYDHVIRNDRELERAIWYVLNNPVKAHLVDSWEKWPWTYVKPGILQD